MDWSIQHRNHTLLGAACEHTDVSVCVALRPFLEMQAWHSTQHWRIHAKS